MNEERIVIVADDSREVAEAMQKFLNIDFPAHRIKTASNGKEALDLYSAHKNQVGLIITDNSMPVMTRAELLLTLRRSNNRVPVIMISGDSEPWYAISLKKFGLNAFLVKPADLNQLHKDIDEALAQ